MIVYNAFFLEAKQPVLICLVLMLPEALGARALNRAFPATKTLSKLITFTKVGRFW